MSFLSRIFGPPIRMSPRDFVTEGDRKAPILDVRTAAEYGMGHLAGARLADVTSADFDRVIAKLDGKGILSQDRPVYLYCRSGSRSGRATKRLRAMGYDQAWNIGGFSALSSAGARVK